MAPGTRRLLVNDLARQDRALLAEIEARVGAVIQRGWYILGAETAAFEAAFAAYCGTAACVGLANGTDALELALRALRVGPGDRVLTVANAGGYSTAAILAAGAEPLYAEIDPDTLLLNVEAVRAAPTSGVQAIIATHLYGRMVDMPALLDAAGGIPVIEDCAQAHGARLAGKAAGAWGRMGCFSFYPTKNLGAFGDAGAVTTSDPALAESVRRLRQYGWERKYESGEERGVNSRLDEIQASILSVKLPRLDGWNARRRQIASRYTELLRDSGVCIPPPAGDAYVAHLYVIRTPHRDRVRERLAAKGIATEVHYPVPDHLQRSNRGAPWSRVTLPATEASARDVLTLPCFPEMEDSEVERVAEAVRGTVSAEASGR